MSLKELLAEVSLQFPLFNLQEMYEMLKFSEHLQTKRRGTRMAVSDIRRQLTEIMNVSQLQQEDITEALRRSEADGLIQLNERAQTIFVRAGVVA